MELKVKFDEEKMKEICSDAAKRIKKALSEEIYKEMQEKSFDLMDNLDVQVVRLEDAKEILDKFSA